MDLLTDEHPLKNNASVGYVAAVEEAHNPLEEEQEDNFRSARVLEKRFSQKITQNGELLEYDILLEFTGDTSELIKDKGKRVAKGMPLISKFYFCAHYKIC